MGLESGTYVEDLNVNNPDGAADPKSQGDNHIKLIKTVLKNTFPGFSGRIARAQTKGGNYTGIGTDNFTLLFFTAAATLSLTAAATLGNGWAVWIYAGSGDVTIDPSGAETVNGAATKVVKSGQMALVMCTGTEHVCMYIPSNAELTSLLQPTGITFAYLGTTAPSGYVMAWGTIGSASSGATNRANADTQTLYELVWNSFADAEAPVAGGRGASAAADFSANKAIALPDIRGRAIFGKDNMGGSAANRLTSAVSGIDGTVLGKAGGDQRSQQHNHTASVTDPGHAHTIATQNSIQQANASTNTDTASSGSQSTSTNTTGISVTVNNSGSGASENVPPAIVLNIIIKL